MTGFEVAGLALAVLPVLFTVLQRYDDILSPLSRFKRFAKEARSYCKEIEIQRTIFRNECRNLLEEIVDHDAASGMLNSPTQPAWSNKRLDEQLAKQLGESLHACLAITALIEERLAHIHEESLGFKSIVEKEKEVSYHSIPSCMLQH
jgi:hypothetical protein